MTYEFRPDSLYPETHEATYSPHGVPMAFDRNRLIYRAGDESDQLYYLLSGQVLLTAPNSGKIIDILESGSLFGEEALLTAPRSFTARVALSAQVIAIDPATIQAPADLLRRALSHLVQRQSRLVDDLSNMKSMPPLQRLAKLLLSIPDIQQGATTAKLPWRKNVMAERIGVRNETFSRLLPSLRQHGAALDGDHVTITDPQALSRFVSGHNYLRRPHKSAVAA